MGSEMCIRDRSIGTHPPTAQGYTSVGDAASGMIPSTALGGYTVSDDIAQDGFGPVILERVAMLVLFLICRCLTLIRVRSLIVILRK